jgi:type 1 glutamine amidotransferase
MRVLVGFVRGGKGLVGIHSASVWEKDPAKPSEAEFRQIIGGRFRNHPWELEPASIRIEDAAHPLNAAWGGKTELPLPWLDELFQFDPPYSRCVFRRYSDTDSDFIRTGFRRMSDSVPEFAGQCSGLIRTPFRGIRTVFPATLSGVVGRDRE